MKEHYIYWIVKGITVIYLLYKIFRFLFGKRGKSIWHFLNPKRKAERKAERKTETLPATAEPDYSSVVGKSQTVYLEKMPEVKMETVEPAFSEDLQKVPAYEEEPEVTADDVDDNLNDVFPDESERFLPFEVSADDEYSSTGVTFEQLGTAIEVIQGKKTENEEIRITSRILYEAQGSDVFDFLAAQAENERMIENLLKENLDSNRDSISEAGRKKRRETEAFDMGKYV